MPELARRYIKTSLTFAVLSSLLSLHMIASQRLVSIPKPLGWLPTAHGHLFLVGFVVMMIMGVSIWMFPRPKDSKYSNLLSEMIYWLMALGTIARAVGEIVASYTPDRTLLKISAIGGLAQGIGILLFVLNIWTRIRAIGKVM